jgi:hypothetical protein
MQRCSSCNSNHRVAVYGVAILPEYKGQGCILCAPSGIQTVSDAHDRGACGHGRGRGRVLTGLPLELSFTLYTAAGGCQHVVVRYFGS